MQTPDQRYIPKAKGKKKSAKSTRAGKEASFPVASPKAKEARPLKKNSPFGKNHVWAN